MNSESEVPWFEISRYSPTVSGHPGLEAGVKIIADGEFKNDSTYRPMVLAMFVGYVEQWHGTNWVPMSVEQEFVLPIRNIDAKRASYSKTFEYAGKLDMLIYPEGEPNRVYLVDHKTSSEDIEPGSDFWKRLLLASQASHYQLACYQLGIAIEGIFWDVIRKPRIRPKRLEKKVIADLKSVGTYCGFPVTANTIAEVMSGLGTENEELFFCRLLGDIHSSPSSWYAQRPIPRSTQEIADYSSELWGTAAAIRQSRTDGKWLKTGATHSCCSYNRTCEFIDLCCGTDHPSNPWWHRAEKVHPELNIVEADGRDILTNSSLTCFRECNKKYEFKYELGLRRHDDDDAMALRIGSAIHRAIEAYWKAVAKPFQEQQAEEESLMFEERV